MKKSAKTICLIMAAMFLLVGCGSKGYRDQATSDGSYDYLGESGGLGVSKDSIDWVNEDAAPSITNTDTPAALANRKLIQNYSARIQTLEFDASITLLEEMIAQSEGYIETSSQNGRGAVDYYDRARGASYTIRIPANKTDSFTGGLSAVGAVIESSKSIEDVTDYYFDTEAHLVALRTQEARLLELMKTADEMADLITLENALSNIRYQIESLDGTLRRVDNQVEYSTVRLTIDEVFDPTDVQTTPKTLGERIKARFNENIRSIRGETEDFIVWFAGNIISIAIFAVIAFFAVKFGKKALKKTTLPKMPDKKDESDKQN